MNHCIIHAKKIHDIHTLYTRTFPHRLMTYQVSYCIYTAATVEALELKASSMSPIERQEAAARLAAAVRVLQSEAAHTPGSGRSLDTIRRLLSEGQRPKFRPHRRRPQNWQQHHRQRRQRHREKGITLSADTRNGMMDTEHNNEGGRHHSPVISGRANMIEDSRRGGNLRDLRQDPDPTARIQASGRGPTTDTSTSAAHENVLATPMPPQNLSLDGGTTGISIGAGWDDLSYFGSTDTGAGFHPESYSWGIPDDFLRMPPHYPIHAPSAPAPSSDLPWGME